VRGGVEGGSPLHEFWQVGALEQKSVAAVSQATCWTQANQVQNVSRVRFAPREAGASRALEPWLLDALKCTFAEGFEKAERPVEVAETNATKGQPKVQRKALPHKVLQKALSKCVVETMEEELHRSVAKSLMERLQRIRLKGGAGPEAGPDDADTEEENEPDVKEQMDLKKMFMKPGLHPELLEKKQQDGGEVVTLDDSPAPHVEVEVEPQAEVKVKEENVEAKVEIKLEVDTKVEVKLETPSKKVQLRLSSLCSWSRSPSAGSLGAETPGSIEVLQRTSH
jgi:hypothetical protein